VQSYLAHMRTVYAGYQLKFNSVNAAKQVCWMSPTSQAISALAAEMVRLDCIYSIVPGFCAAMASGSRL